MPLFALADGRALPVRPTGSVDAWSEQVATDLRDAVLDVVGVPLLPIAWRDDDEVLGDYLVALDSTGAAVVVVVRESLDGEALVAALARSAVVRRAPWRDVATWYPDGPDALRQDWADFRESIPPRGEAAPGLMIVSAALADGVRSAVEVLDGATVAVHQVGLGEHEGQPMLSVEPVSARLLPRHVVLEADSDGVTLVGGVGPALVEAASVQPEPEPEPWAEVEEPEESEESELPAEPAPEPQTESEEPEVPAGPEESATELDAPDPAEQSEARLDGASRRGRRRPAPAPDPRGALRAVVDLVGEAELVLTEDPAAEPALLAEDGVIVTAGRQFADPGAAAATALGRDVPDGWLAWRFGAEGPYLGEALEEALSGPRPRGRGRRAVRR
ncbi:hypothetical protein [Miniimonas sp. S16]|uniref:hypothetical protein n=1 Tax=Miniimonas sp. S16 TaxID=2171623 RepID=UPI000D527C74|nr:hypothetical protein [Miniimonas sp. S16]